MVVDPSGLIRPKVGIGGLDTPCQLGDVTIQQGSGSPSAAYNALAPGDLYFDTTNGIMYIATAAGSSSWQQFTAATATLASGTTIGGTSYFTGSGTPKSVVTPIRIGDGYTDYTNGNEWIAIGTTNTSWVLIAQGVASGSGIVQTYVGTINQTQAQAGATLIAAQTGHTLKVIYMKLIVPATVGGSGTLTFTDTSATVTILAATEAALATASGASTVISSELATALSGVTYGAGLLGTALTAANGIKFAAAASLTLTTPITVIIEYMVS